MSKLKTTQNHCFCSIDWASQKHYVVVKDCKKAVLYEGFIAHSQSSFEQMLCLLNQKRHSGEVPLIYEGSRGAIFNAFVGVPWIKLCPVNPIKTKRLNELDGSAKGKSDPRDAHLLCDYLIDNFSKLRDIYIEKDIEYRKLEEWVRCEHDLIKGIKALKQRIKADLSTFIPELNGMITDLEKPVYQDYLMRFDRLQHMALDPIKRFLYQHNVRSAKSIETFINIHKKLKAIGSNRDFHSNQLKIIRLWVQLLQSNCLQLKQCRQEIHAIFDQLPQAHIYTSQPGAGDRIAPRLAALFGSKPQKAFQHKRQALAYFGQSPVTEKSGKSSLVFKRFNCNGFARHTCFLWAYSVNKARGDRWQKRYLTKLKGKGDKAPTRYRKLGCKIVPILYKCLCDNITYNEDTYQKNTFQFKHASN